MEKALETILNDNAEITAIVGDNVYPVSMPQEIGEYRGAITFTRISGVRDHAMSGPTGLVESRFEINCYGRQDANGSAYANAKDLAKAVRGVVLPAGGFKETVDGVEVQGIFLNDERDSREKPAGGIGWIDRVRLDLTIWHKE